MTNLACEPLQNYRSLSRKLFSPFGVVPSEGMDGPCRRLRKEEEIILDSLGTQIADRKRNLEPRLAAAERSRIRLTDADLRLVLRQGAAMTRDFYPPRVFTRLSAGERRRFWADRGLSEGDWLGLSCHLLKGYFSREFLTPLQDLDGVFELEVPSWTAGRYVDLVTKSRGKDDLVDLAKAVYPRRHSCPTSTAQSLVFPDFSVDDFFVPLSESSHSAGTVHHWSRRFALGASGATFRRILHSEEERSLWRVYRHASEVRVAKCSLARKLSLLHPAVVALLILKREDGGKGGGGDGGDADGRDSVASGKGRKSERDWERIINNFG